jgi:hypothetical protein
MLKSESNQLSPLIQLESDATPLHFELTSLQFISFVSLKEIIKTS